MRPGLVVRQHSQHTRNPRLTTTDRRLPEAAELIAGLGGALWMNWVTAVEDMIEFFTADGGWIFRRRPARRRRCCRTSTRWACSACRWSH